MVHSDRTFHGVMFKYLNGLIFFLGGRGGGGGSGKIWILAILFKVTTQSILNSRWIHFVVTKYSASFEFLCQD